MIETHMYKADAGRGTRVRECTCFQRLLLVVSLQRREKKRRLKTISLIE